MNREQRRTYAKKLRSNGISNETVSNIARLKRKLDSVPWMAEGEKVRLNMKSILADKDYEKKQDKWKQFVQDNKDTIFTVEWDAKHRDNPVLVCLKEDPSPVKWLWWVGDLEVVK
jgi:hypothetical protein